LNFHRATDLSPDDYRQLDAYDRDVLRLLGGDFPFPVRMRDWEIRRVLEATADLPRDSRVLEAGSFNTYLGLHLSRIHPRIIVSDLLWQRALKSLARRLRLAPQKKTEAGFLVWYRAMRRHGVHVRNVDLTRIPWPTASFDCVIALSVVEHVPQIEMALAEMYRLLAPGGRLLLTTDCAPEPKAYADRVRYFSEAELETLFAPYPVVSPRNHPDFSRENWCYGGVRPIVTAFVEIRKPAK
jgi:SAM-dependent methyltransferase